MREDNSRIDQRPMGAAEAIQLVDKTRKAEGDPESLEDVKRYFISFLQHTHPEIAADASDQAASEVSVLHSETSGTDITSLHVQAIESTAEKIDMVCRVDGAMVAFGITKEGIQVVLTKGPAEKIVLLSNIILQSWTSYLDSSLFRHDSGDMKRKLLETERRVSGAVRRGLRGLFS